MPTVNEYESAWNFLTESMNEEANEQDLCVSYDDFIERVNRRLPSGIQVPSRLKGYEVSFTVELNSDAKEGLEAAIDAYVNERCGTEIDNFTLADW